MTREDIRKRVDDILSSYAVKIECIDGVVKVYKNTYFGYAHVLSIYDDMVELDGIRHNIKKGGAK